MESETQRRQILDNLPPEVVLLFELEKLKDIARQNPLSSGTRRELVGEHSWHIALGVLLLAEFSPEEVDIAHAVLLAIVHDVAEAFVGDTFAFDAAAVSTQHDREQTAMAELGERYKASPAAFRLIELWEEYEAQETPEARFVKGIDAFIPIFLNYSNIDQSSWIQHKVEAAKVLKRLNRVQREIGPLADINSQMIASAVTDGYLT